MNAFETSKQKMVPSVLLYARYEKKILMIHRNARPGTDFHHGKWNGLGGKFEAGESVLDASVREWGEEAGCRAERDQFQVLGVLHFPNFKPQRAEDWLTYVVQVAGVSPEQVPQGLVTPEGTLHWVPEDEILGLNLWEGDKKFLPLVLERRPFVGTFWYRDGLLSRHEIQLLLPH